jgi:hypothetical protein
MKVFGKFPLWASILILLLLINLGWMCWNACHNSVPDWVAKRFIFESFHTNDVTSFGIVDARTGRPILNEGDFGDDLKPGTIDYYFQGTNVLDVTVNQTDLLPRYQFIFRGSGKSQVWWINLDGGPFFNARIFYNTNGERTNYEIWYNQSWQTVDRRNGKNGIVINGQWHRLGFDTNRRWTIEASETPKASAVTP